MCYFVALHADCSRSRSRLQVRLHPICAGLLLRLCLCGVGLLLLRFSFMQDLKCFVFSLISAHFKIQPIQK